MFHVTEPKSDGSTLYLKRVGERSTAWWTGLKSDAGIFGSMTEANRQLDEYRVATFKTWNEQGRGCTTDEAIEMAARMVDRLVIVEVAK